MQSIKCNPIIAILIETPPTFPPPTGPRQDVQVRPTAVLGSVFPDVRERQARGLVARLPRADQELQSRP